MLNAREWISLFEFSFVEWSPGHWLIGPKLRGTVSSPLALRPFSVSNDCFSVPLPSKHILSESDAWLDTRRFLGPDVWLRQPTDPSCQNW